jgi:hypothetical protein
MIDLTTISATPMPEALKKINIMNEKLRKQNAIMASAICIGAFFCILFILQNKIVSNESKLKEEQQ